MKRIGVLGIFLMLSPGIAPYAADKISLILIQTDLGNIKIEVFEQKAPQTSANFLRYVDEQRYRGATFYRVYRPDNQPGVAAKIGAIEGGLRFDDRTKRFPPIAHEPTSLTGIRHLDGTLSLTRNMSGEASSEFIICVGDQPALDDGGPIHPDGRGFAAFGRVIDGMDIVRKIQQIPADGQILVQKVKIIDAIRFLPTETEKQPLKKKTA